jgi:hypothetical protein
MEWVAGQLANAKRGRRDDGQVRRVAGHPADGQLTAGTHGSAPLASGVSECGDRTEMQTIVEAQWLIGSDGKPDMGDALIVLGEVHSGRERTEHAIRAGRD